MFLNYLISVRIPPSPQIWSKDFLDKYFLPIVIKLFN